MELFLTLLKAFIVGGAICTVGQLLIDLTRLTPAKILVSFVIIGVILGAIGVYEPLVEWAGAGATLPLTGFGYNLAKGTREAIAEKGMLGILSGPLSSASVGIMAAVICGLVVSLFAKSKDKQ
ncbi:MAG: stage V sporulation protein AE [Ruminococcaceae bacterium]|nr:stage V sporulation protein AE [Oscillospiraceae bacterium]